MSKQTSEAAPRRLKKITGHLNSAAQEQQFAQAAAAISKDKSGEISEARLRRVVAHIGGVLPKVEKSPTISNQVEDISDIFTETYLEELVSLGKKEQADILRKVFAFQKEEKSYSEYEKFIAKEFFGKADGEKISLEDLERVPNFIDAMAEFAKINDALRRVRNVANQEFFDKTLRNKTADSFEYALQQFAESGVTAAEAQEYLNRIKVSTSTTSHPTNPASVAFTREAMNLANIFAEFSGKKQAAELDAKMRSQIKTLIATPLTDAKKTQEQEIEEGLLYVDSIYDAHSKIGADFNKATSALKQYEGLKLPQDVFEPCVWITGDGDGNPNSTEESLRKNIAAFRARVKERYKEDLQKLGAAGREILAKFDGYKNVEEFISDLEQKGLTELAGKAKTFGFHYAKIDIRQEAGDIMQTVYGLLKTVGAPVPAKWEELTAAQIKGFFEDKEIIARIQDLRTKDINPAVQNDLTRRIFGRLRAVAENPDMSGKLIIAEFKTPANAEAALFLLKASGNEVCNGKAKMNVVPLAEEKNTLEQLPQDLKTILSGNYLEHIKSTKKIYFMIAKSDTVRRDGVGAQEAQEMAVKNSIKEIIRALLNQGVEDLENYQIIPFNGGGHALQRGGGRLSELPSVYGRHALKAFDELQTKMASDFAKEMVTLGTERKKDALRRSFIKKYTQVDKIKVNAPCLTVQGHQNYLLFAPKEVGGGFLSSMASQALYAEGRLRKKISNKEVEELPGKKEMTGFERKAFKESAAAARHVYCEASVEKYKMVKEPKGVINKLYEKACWPSTTKNNKSSRGERAPAAVGAGVVYKSLESISGKGKELLNQRAIGAEKLCAHSGTHLISWFSVKDGLQEVKRVAAAGKGCTLNEMYRGSKSTRDSMRGIATSLFMVDFELSWQMMAGGKRPLPEQLSGLQSSYFSKMRSGRQAEIRPEETLAFLEGEYMATAKLVYETIYGKEPGPDFNPKKLLDKWPDIREEIQHREERCRFAHVVETHVTDLINKNPQAKDSEVITKLIEHAYCGADFTNTPLGILLSLTKERGAEKTNGNRNTQIFEKFSEIKAAKVCGAEEERKRDPSSSLKLMSAGSLVATPILARS